MTNIGNMKFDQCQEYALTSGNKYFGLQSVDNNGNGTCLVSNELSLAQRYGEGMIYTAVPLWNSDTGAGKGAYCDLSSKGSLTVYDSNNTQVYATTHDRDSGVPSNYMGCYWDWWDRAMPLLNADGTFSTWGGGSKWDNDYQSAYQYALQNNYKYFSNQASYLYNSEGKGQAGFSNDFANSTKYGTANNCGSVNGFIGGGPWSNAIYSTDGNINSFIVLQDDGNLVIYRGMGPNDNQGVIWATDTYNKTLVANKNFAASNGKTGKNWMANGTKLNPGEFIGSDNGVIYLMMQSDGNLVLYTSTKTGACSASSSAGGKTVGAQNINGLYQMDMMGIKGNISELAYIDQNAELHTYPSNNKQGNTDYTLVASGIDSWGNDIPNTAYGNATYESCQKTCNSSPDCGGFVMNAANNVCWPKTPSFYPNGNIAVNPDRKIFVRGQTPINPPIGVPNSVTNVDTIKYQSYVKGGAIGTEYGLANATAVQKQQLEQLQTRMNLLSNQISRLTGNFDSGNNQAIMQSKTNADGIQDYLKGINTTDDKIKNFNTNVERILTDSDIVVLQQNYNYLFWSILAAGTVLVSMNIVKK
jgi:hypothetical protein